jgi:hypothetical protein
MKRIQPALLKLGYLQWILAISFVFPWHGSSRAATEKESTPQPLWEVGLSKFGCQARPQESREAGSWWRDRQSLVFTQENVLATTFQVHIENSGFSVRDKTLPTDPYHMVALFLDAGRGEPIKKADWSPRIGAHVRTFPIRPFRCKSCDSRVCTFETDALVEAKIQLFTSEIGTLSPSFSSLHVEGLHQFLSYIEQCIP